MSVSDTACVVSFVNVGQGDCTVVVEARSRSAIMIDCPNPRYANARAVLEVHGIDHLQAFLVSHWDQDHWSALPKILSDYRPELVAYNNESVQLLRAGSTSDEERSRATTALRSLKKGWERGDFKRGQLHEGFRQSLGAVTVTALAPSFDEASDALAGTRIDKNLASAVMLLACHGFRAVIGGDAPARVWSRLRNEYSTLTADLFRSPHHGSMSVDQGARLEAFRSAYDWLEPSEVVHSVGSGGHRYGHPNPESIQAAGRRGIRVLCTSVTAACCELGDEGDLECAGTVEIQVDSTGSWSRAPSESEHAETVDSWGPHAMCRRWGGGPPTGWPVSWVTHEEHGGS